MNQQTVRAPLRQFSVPLSATRRGARLARLLAAERLNAWNLPLDPARLVVAELAANAALHGHVPGRSFRLTLSVPGPGTLRIVRRPGVHARHGPPHTCIGPRRDGNPSARA